jgi:hypothetical protein
MMMMMMMMMMTATTTMMMMNNNNNSIQLIFRWRKRRQACQTNSKARQMQFLRSLMFVMLFLQMLLSPRSCIATVRFCLKSVRCLICQRKLLNSFAIHGNNNASPPSLFLFFRLFVFRSLPQTPNINISHPLISISISISISVSTIVSITPSSQRSQLHRPPSKRRQPTH